MKKIAFLLLMLILWNCAKEEKLKRSTGAVFGTSYGIIYDAEADFQADFDRLYELINESMSTYLPNSRISKINRNELVSIDTLFEEVLLKSYEIYESTNGVFDPTIGAVVNAWDFGPEGQIMELDSIKIDSLMQNVGLNKVTLEGKELNKLEGTYIDFNAIAKGYAVDVIAEFLSDKGVNNYLVEIGGEIRVKGQNIEKQSPWTVGIDRPNFDGSQSVMSSLSLQDEAMATSGTYRKFKTDSLGNRYAHIIDTETGYPSKTNILSVSVIASDCMTADAYATAFQAMGIEGVEQFLSTHEELKVFLVFENDRNELETFALNGFSE